MNLEIKNIPFVSLTHAELEQWQCKALPDYYDLYAKDALFVNASDLDYIAIELKKYKEEHLDYMFCPSSRVMATCPAFMSSVWVPKHSRRNKPYDYKFSTGHYHSLFELLFMDDVIQWSHSRIETKDVRTAAQIVWKLAGYKTKLNNKNAYWP